MIQGTHKNNFLNSFENADNIFIYCKQDVEWIKAIPNIDLYTDKDLVINKIKNSTENVDIVILMSNGDNTYIINKLK
jgi:UDP-N-acetylmuramate-alanine ligase